MPIRIRGLLIAMASAVTTGVVYIVLLEPGASSVPRAAALPLAGVFWGLIELVGGVPLPALQDRWATLPSAAQQGLGCLVLLMTLGLFVLAIRIL